jgi:uncharacterized protein (DUF736 family)
MGRIETSNGECHGTDRFIQPRRKRPYTGEIRTLTLKVKATIRPIEREHDKSPDYRVSAGAVDYA